MCIQQTYFAELLNSEQGKIVTKKYIAVAKSMRDYEETVTTNHLVPSR